MNGVSNSVWTYDSGGFTGSSYVAWACADCFGKSFIMGFKHGVTTQGSISFSRDTTITTTIGEYEITLLKQKYKKSVSSGHEFFRPKGLAPSGPIDTSYVSYVDCGAGDIDDDYANYGSSTENEDSVIYYADLRDDILVYWHEHSSGSASDVSGTAPMGQGLGFGGWEGGAGACKGVNTLDAIKLSPSLSNSRIRSEVITLGDFTPYMESTSGGSSVNIAVTTGAPSCGGVSNECVGWGGYDRIDQTKKYDCKTGEYEVEVLVEPPVNYYNSWDVLGTYPIMTQYDGAQYEANAKGQGVKHLANGTYDYPSFINIDPLPHGSFVTDAEGNYFYSMITSDLKTFNKLNTEDPDKYSQISTNNEVLVYYPVAPV